MESLVKELEAIQVELPNVEASGREGEEESAPESYRANSKKEHLLLSYAENFQRQFRQLYGDRKTLFLRPVNECGVEKFVCTSLRPTQLPYKELYDYDGCAAFVADYLTYESLKPPNELPRSLVSPTLVLKRQRGNSFDYSVLLCSLLIGAGYDAYCVCGYGSQDVALLNQTRKPCPLLEEKNQVTASEEELKGPKYTVRPPRTLNSQFLVRQEDKKQALIIAEGRKRREEEEAKQAEAEKPPPDKFHGLRFHCWVLVLSGKREVAQSFFIEPTTGEEWPLDWTEYLGIETLWNHKNFWVNMQDCSQGMQGLVYDLGDATKWEFFFPNVEKPLLIVPGEEQEMEEAMEEEEDDHKVDFELPPSWVLPIEVSARDFETRCPRGSKAVLYRKAKLDKFADYLNQDGLVTRLSLYHDLARTQVSEVRSTFRHREDRLQSKVEHGKMGKVEEWFGPGRPRALEEHIHHGSNPMRAANRTMVFYSYARVDGLAKREMTATETTEHFENRPDFLYYRHVTFSKVGKKFESAEASQQRPIVVIVERFHRNPLIPPNSDVAEWRFLLTENRIKVVYHLEENRITPSIREFLTPPLRGEKATTLTYNPEMATVYQVDPYVTDPKDRHLFEQLEGLVRAQEESIAQVRAAENETQDILNARLKEELNTILSISVYDVDRNEKARAHKQEMEQRLAEEERVRKEKERDYLAPFLARIGDPPVLQKQQMQEVAEDCLKDLRMRLVDMANIIQRRFERETEDLQSKQAWYKANQGSLTREDEAEYISHCNEALFRIHILEQRLNRHKTTAPQKYLELERRLKADPRLGQLYAQ